MAISKALNNGWDLYLDENGSIATVQQADQVAQHIRQRVNFFYEEWFLDRNAGLPWYQQFFTKPTRQVLIESTIKKEIAETPEVVAITAFSFDFNNGARNFSGKFDVDTEYGLIFGDLV